ncbi:MAG: 50S ribosomal protein L15 [bacterium]|nr:50S ribosomal protein L15 [bacterium]
MKLTDLYPAMGSTKKSKRVGRGPGCHGKTSGRGENGQNSRSGGGKGPAFEGGQTPWYRRLPKFRGFKNHFKTIYTEINLDTLEKFGEQGDVTPEALYAAGIIRNLKNPVKVLGSGEVTRALNVKMHAFTGSAKEAIEKAGGTAEVI